jgi:hypothetical protein
MSRFGQVAEQPVGRPLDVNSRLVVHEKMVNTVADTCSQRVRIRRRGKYFRICEETREC